MAPARDLGFPRERVSRKPAAHQAAVERKSHDPSGRSSTERRCPLAIAENLAESRIGTFVIVIRSARDSPRSPTTSSSILINSSTKLGAAPLIPSKSRITAGAADPGGAAVASIAAER